MMQEPTIAIPFIVYNEKCGFTISSEAEEFLSKMPKERKLGVISIVGKYRTGKSFFVNRVLLNRAGEDKGFSVGPTINPCTKGLWLWKRAIPSEQDNMDILLVDTEGFGGMDENVNHDSRIFLFSLLLSSYFIYNSVGSIDENALNNLSLIINLAKDIQLKKKGKESENEDTSGYFPSFLWVVRDFALKIVDSLGNPITQKDYLEKALELQKGVSDQTESKNRIRRLMKHFFKERDCATLVRPVESEKDLQRLNEMQESELRPEFIDQITQLRKKIYKKIKPKTLQGKPLNGQMLIDICRSYIDAINNGGLPNIENAWNYVCKAESVKAMQICVQQYQQKLESVDNPIELNEIEKMKQFFKDELIKSFKKKAIAPEEDLKEFYAELEKQFEDHFKTFKKKNKILWKKKYEEVCNDQIKQIEQKLLSDEYQNYYEFQADYLKLKEQYDVKVPKGPSKDLFWKEISENLHRMAAEKVSKKIERSLDTENRKLESRLMYLEQDQMTKKKDWEEERQQNAIKISDLEKQLMNLRAAEGIAQEKINRIKEEKDKLEMFLNEKSRQCQEGEQRIEKTYQDKMKDLEHNYEKLRNEQIREMSKYEKNQALLEQEANFLKRENQGLSDKVQFYENENKKLKNEVNTNKTINDLLKQQINENEQSKLNEIKNLKNEFDKKVYEITEDADKKKDILKQFNELAVEKTYLENQVNFLKNQLEENKRLHDALLLALQQGMNHGDGESNNELVETNRNLSAAMDKMEMRCKILEEKNEKLKTFKRMAKNCSALQCLHCSKFIANSIFLQHLSACMNLQATQAQQNIQNTSHSNYSQPTQFNNNNNSFNQNNSFISGVPSVFLNLDPNGLLININQTMVRESPDNKPYTEYLIQINYSTQKWTVARKYKNFCELHSNLMAVFPGMKFPDSSMAIINSTTDINSVFYSKRPTVIEDRRKALQQYIRDLSKIDMIRNSKPFKNFLEIEKQLDIKQQQLASSLNTSQHFQDIMQQQQQNNSQATSKIDMKNNAQFYGQCNISSISNNTSYTNTVPSTSRIKDDKDCSFLSNFQKNPFYLAEELPPKEQTSCSYKIDKKMLPQSPSSFLKAWNEKNQNKENKNPSRSKSSTDPHNHNLINVSNITSKIDEVDNNTNGNINQNNNNNNNILANIDNSEYTQIQHQELNTGPSEKQEKNIQSKHQQQHQTNISNDQKLNNQDNYYDKVRQMPTSYFHQQKNSQTDINKSSLSIKTGSSNKINTSQDGSKSSLMNADKKQNNPKNYKNNLVSASPASPVKNKQWTQLPQFQ